MATKHATRTPLPGTDPGPAPLAGTRSQTIQRLQVGLFGLAVMILLIGLATVLMSHARRNEDQSAAVPQTAAASQAAASTGSDPLADAGVVPDMPADTPTAEPSAPNSSQR